MPKYEVTDNLTGKKYQLEGDSPPTQEELEGIFAEQRQKTTSVPAPQAAPESSLWDKLGMTANRVKQAADKSIAGTLGIPGDASNWLRQVLGYQDKSPFPTSEAIYNTLFAPPKGLEVPPAETFGEKATEFVSGLLPDLLLSGTSAALKKAGPSMMSKAGTSLYRSGLKPGTAEGIKETNKVVDTLMANRIPYTEKGFDKLNTMISGLSQQADDIIGRVAQNQAPAASVIDEVRGLKAGVANAPLRAELEKGIDDIADKMAANIGRNSNLMAPMTPAQQNTTVGELNKLKKWVYEKYRSYYGAETPPLQAEAHMAAARGARKEIERHAPEVANVNEDIGKLLEARGYLDRATGRIANYEPPGMQLVPGVMANLAGTPAGSLALGAASTIGRMPGPRSSMAFLLDSLGKSKVPTAANKLLMIELLKSLKGNDNQ